MVAKRRFLPSGVFARQNWERLKKALFEYMTTSHPSCRLFRMLLPKMLKEQGLDESLVDDSEEV